MNALLLATTFGALGAFGVWAILHGALAPVDPRLGDALDLLDGRLQRPVAQAGADRLGSWLLNTVRRPISEQHQRLLRLSGRSIEHHYTLKALGAAAGLLAPLLVAALGSWAFDAGFAVIALISPFTALLGFFLPDLLLNAADHDITEDATEALLTYFDLVMLERLANQSGSQSLRAAASVSDITVFTLIRETLERARLEQRAPYADLRQLGRELGLPALNDIADVMSLDESGASLASALQARVSELRDAHLTNAKLAAAEISERMTFFMVVPALVFAGFFLVPPLLRLMAG